MVNIFIFSCFFLAVTATIKNAVVEMDKETVITGVSDDSITLGERIKSGSSFLGIPYAKPPVGSRRFLRPEVPDALSSPYNATFYRPHCPQTETGQLYIKNFIRDEDCLYLNVFVPGDVLPSNKLPVMIWLHGGAFVQGGADIYSGDILSAFNDVIVVTLNYRLNILGFLSDGTKSSGNFGLWDQKMAIEWVHNNIEHFGGDTTKVTLFGESAGAASVIYQAINVNNKGLFQRIISESGSPLAPWALQKNPAATFQKFSDIMKCNTNSNEATLTCLRNKTTEELLSNMQTLDTFSPTVDEDFIKENPVTLFANKTQSSIEAMRHFSDLDFLSGVNSKDGAMLVTRDYWPKIMSQMKIDISKGVPRYFFAKTFIPGNMLYLVNNSNTAIVQAVLHTYTDWFDPDNPATIRENMVSFSSDLLFFVPALVTASKQLELTQTRSTYFYVFDHKPMYLPEPQWLEGAVHAAEIPYVFGIPNSMKVVANIPKDTPLIVPPNDIKLTNAMMAMWTNFAKTGDPNSATLVQQGIPEWPKYKTNTQLYLQFSANMTSDSVKHHLAAPRVAFWTELAPKLESCSVKTCPDCQTTTGGDTTSAGTTDKTTSLYLMSLLLSVCLFKIQHIYVC